MESHKRYQEQCIRRKQMRKDDEQSYEKVNKQICHSQYQNLTNPIQQTCLQCACCINKKDLKMLPYHCNFIVWNFDKQDINSEIFRNILAAALNSPKHTIIYIWEKIDSQNDHKGFSKQQIAQECDQVNSELQKSSPTQYYYLSIAAIEVINNYTEPSEYVIKITFESPKTCLKIHVYNQRIWVFSDQNQLKCIDSRDIYEFMKRSFNRKIIPLHYGLKCSEDQYMRCEKLPKGDSPRSYWYLQLKNNAEDVWLLVEKKISSLGPQSVIKHEHDIRYIEIVKFQKEVKVNIILISSLVSANRTRVELKNLIRKCEGEFDPSKDCLVQKTQIKIFIRMNDKQEFESEVINQLPEYFKKNSEISISPNTISCADPYDSAKIYWYLKSHKGLNVEFQHKG